MRTKAMPEKPSEVRAHDEADRKAVARQKICPVTGAPLGSRGQIVKVFVAEHPWYLSGEDCVAAVMQAPQRFLPPPPPMPVPGR